jgi:hypothetical protein
MKKIEVIKIKRGWIGGKTKLTVSSPFGVLRINKRHNGIDIAIKEGTPIYSPVSGNLQCKFDKAGGLYLTIRSNDIKYYLMHLSNAIIEINSSKIVKEGDLIGYSGGRKGDKNAGISTGPHLHFECRYKPFKKSAAFNPTALFSDALIDRNGNTYNKEIKDIPMISSFGVSEKDFFVKIDVDESNEDIPNISDETATESEQIVKKEVQTGLASGIWQITKLLIDGNVADLRLHDAATSIQAGSLISFFNKVCQQPFAEFIGDTFGDQYYFIVRKPPFDKEGMLKTLVSQGLRGSDNSAISFGQSVYDIREEDIISTNLQFNTQNIYSWYQFYPVYEMGLPQELKYIIPAVLFPEYASIYGSRDLSIQSQYRSFNKKFIQDELNEKNKSKQGDHEVRHTLRDFKFIIESNAYNPFTRQGTIQIVGNRRIKRGMFIRVLESQNMNNSEIFYVDSVSHDYSITSSGVNRTTTLSVSHGMIEKYMFEGESLPKYIDDKYIENGVSYFNIIDFGKTSEENLKMSSWMDVISSWKVNIDVFRFFLRKMQFLK